jgi:hypothetical protein
MFRRPIFRPSKRVDRPPAFLLVLPTAGEPKTEQALRGIDLTAPAPI